MGMVADSVNFLVAIHDGTSKSRTNIIDVSARALSADSSLGVLFRVGVIHGRVFIKSKIGIVMLFSISVPFGIPFAMFDGWWRGPQMAFHARVTTFVIALWIVLGTMDSICLYVRVSVNASEGSKEGQTIPRACRHYRHHGSTFFRKVDDGRKK